MSRASCTSSGHSACGPAKARATPASASRLARAAFTPTSSLRALSSPPPDRARRPSSASPSITALTASSAIPLGATFRLPANRSGPCSRSDGSLRPRSQVTSPSGSDDSTFRSPLKLSPGASRPASVSWVVPGARASSRSTIQPSASPLNSAAMFCTGRPPSVTLSASMSRWVANGGAGTDETRPRKPGSNCVGSVDAVSFASNRSASSWRADSVARSDGVAPKMTSAAPESFSPISSAPYTASSCSNFAAAGSALSLADIFHGVCSRLPLASAARSAIARDRVTAPSKRGTCPSPVTTPSRSRPYGRSPGSMLRCSRVPAPSALRPEEMRNG